MLFTGDVNPANEVTASLFSERHLCLPPSAADVYFPVLQGLLREYAIDVYVPLIDAEVAQATALRTTLPTIIACNSQEFCEAAIAKSRYSQWLDIAGIAVPAPLTYDELRNIEHVVAKRDGGFGGRATQIVESADAAHHLLQNGWTLYPYIDGEEYTVDCFPLDGDVATSVRQRLEVKSGVCTKARIVRDDVLAELALHLCQRFSLTEPFCFQTRKAEGLHYLIDINPRLGAGTAMSALNGMDFFAAHLARLSERSPLEFLQPRFAECVVTRQYGEYLMSASP
ncbi:ATP-grasp domain-containing protein [Xanthomonadaceae bacterium JHOS43]|nr:ATP-grasp domain-containing protein [Xanthomonadaceae bacterium JHOS43]